MEDLHNYYLLQSFAAPVLPYFENYADKLGVGTGRLHQKKKTSKVRKSKKAKRRQQSKSRRK